MPPHTYTRSHSRIFLSFSWKFFLRLFFSCFARRKIDDKQRVFACITRTIHSRLTPSVACSRQMTAETRTESFHVVFLPSFGFRIDAIKDHKLDCYWGFFIILFMPFYMLRLNKINPTSDQRVVARGNGKWFEGRKIEECKRPRVVINRCKVLLDIDFWLQWVRSQLCCIEAKLKYDDSDFLGSSLYINGSRRKVVFLEAKTKLRKQKLFFKERYSRGNANIKKKWNERKAGRIVSLKFIRQSFPSRRIMQKRKEGEKIQLTWKWNAKAANE